MYVRKFSQYECHTSTYCILVLYVPLVRTRVLKNNKNPFASRYSRFFAMTIPHTLIPLLYYLTLFVSTSSISIPYEYTDEESHIWTQ